jgi:hypothetical protein
MVAKSGPSVGDGIMPDRSLDFFTFVNYGFTHFIKSTINF